MSEELALRPAGPDDAPAIAELRRRSRLTAPMPVEGSDVAEPGTGDDDETWVAEALGAPGVVVGYVRLHGAWLEDLYVDPRAQRSGVGSALLDLVRALRPDGFALWVLAQNAPARRFYAARGLVELESTDGSQSVEGVPEVRVAWPGTQPLRHWREAIDDVDLELAQLLARRVALTAAVQELKVAGGGAAGQDGRDRVREREILRRMSAHAPGLDPGLLERVMSTVIEESLARWQGPDKAPAGRRARG